MQLKTGQMARNWYKFIVMFSEHKYMYCTVLAEFFGNLN